MRLKSTGLGSTELIGDLVEMEKSMTGVLMRVKINRPVDWRVRVYIQQRDLRSIIWYAIKPRNVWFVIKFFLGKLNPLKKSEASSEK